MPRCISESIRALGTDGPRVVRLFDFHTAPGVDRSDGSALQSVNGFDGLVDSLISLLS